MNLDITASFRDVPDPTPFGIFDADPVFQHDADAMVRFVYTKLGGRTLGVELHNKDVYASLEEAMLEYSSMVNNYQARSVISSLLGSPTGSIMQNNRMVNPSLAQAVRAAGAYSSEALVGGHRTLHSGSIMLRAGTQKYDLQQELSASGAITANQRIQVEQVFHFAPTNSFLFMNPNSAFNYLNAEFRFESYSPQTVFYMLPVWEDVLRASQMKNAERIRRSNYSWNILNNELWVYPLPTTDIPLYLTYYIGGEDPYANMPDGVTTNISNAPFGNLVYSNINALGHAWVRRLAFALAKEVLGQVRSKIAEIPIPDGALTLNGPDLIAQAREEQNLLREELRTLLDTMTYSSLAQQELNQADALQRQLAKVPTLIYVGAYLLCIMQGPSL